MAALAPHNTGRVWISYTVGDHQHEFQVRYGAAGNDIATVTAARALITSMLGRMAPNVIFSGARTAAAGSDLSFPIAFGEPLQGSNGGALEGVARAQYVDFIGRGPTGHKVKLALYGVNINLPPNYRAPLSYDAVLGAAHTVLEASPSVFVDISGANPTWYQYVNFGFNAYWQRALR